MVSFRVVVVEAIVAFWKARSDVQSCRSCPEHIDVLVWPNHLQVGGARVMPQKMRPQNFGTTRCINEEQHHLVVGQSVAKGSQKIIVLCLGKVSNGLCGSCIVLDAEDPRIPHLIGPVFA